LASPSFSSYMFPGYLWCPPGLDKPCCLSSGSPPSQHFVRPPSWKTGECQPSFFQLPTWHASRFRPNWVNSSMWKRESSIAWQTGRGTLTWTPHPALPESGLNLLGGGGGVRGNWGGGGAGNADGLTGGYPMPGACPTWTPGTWPPAATSRSRSIQLAPWMIPNPCNAVLPHIMWDVSQLPTTANRITGNHVIVSLGGKLDDVATHPAVDRLVVACQVGVAERFGGTLT